MNAHRPSRGRRIAVAGFVVSTVLQAVLVVLGLAYILTDGRTTSLVLLLTWCGVGTAYAVGILLVLRTASLSAESDEPPMLLELGLVPRALSLVATILVSFVGVTATVQHILLEPHDEVDVALDVIGIWAMILAWVLFHWGFAQLYLQLYYRETDPPLRFPSAAAPGILEFAYFAYTLAVSLAVSDVDVLDRRMRWRVLVHSVLSFFFNGLIIVTALGAISEIGNGVL
ncbi:DUF1345 domain-containing protein [Microbacterium sp. Gd 4-13]|uniref:DUF1345 domain-containing protein n=1 Tax=Microbacterium sp. Gd 4-13 TaxID=2173179 RepID=UPI000D57266F|nr:DUF1345 domain-containing protein [Microbacterium sp. Gd 4-13]PVW04338.1 DUF1345 domain-containing protein [Microbacterium sp. Gd 4-13]